MTTVSRPVLRRFLDRLASRSLLSQEEQNAILALPGSVEHVRPRRDIVRIGERVDHACLVLEGLVGRFGQNSEGDRQMTGLFIAGDMPDLRSVVQPIASAELQALVASTVVKVPHAALRAAMARFPALGEAFWRDCVADWSITAQWVVNMGCRDCKTRIAHLLCEMATRLEVAPTHGKIVFPFPLTQEQLAEVTGMTAVHVNRTLQAIRKAGLIEQVDGLVRIQDWEALARAGEFDPAYLQLHIKQDHRIRILPVWEPTETSLEHSAGLRFETTKLN